MAFGFAMTGDADGVGQLIDGEVTGWHVIMLAGIFIIFESICGIVGLKKNNGPLLHAYLLCLVLSLVAFVGVFFAAAFYANRADEYVDKHWDETIYPELVRSNATRIPTFQVR